MNGIYYCSKEAYYHIQNILELLKPSFFYLDCAYDETKGELRVIAFKNEEEAKDNGYRF